MNRFNYLKGVRNILISLPISLAALPVVANDFTAAKVLKGMQAKEQYSYLAGIVEGLAVARYMKDGKKSEGMTCIYDWFYDDKQTLPTILSAFEKYDSYKPGAIIDVLAKQKCGE